MSSFMLGSGAFVMRKAFPLVYSLQRLSTAFGAAPALHLRFFPPLNGIRLWQTREAELYGMNRVAGNV